LLDGDDAIVITIFVGSRFSLNIRSILIGKLAIIVVFFIAVVVLIGELIAVGISIIIMILVVSFHLYRDLGIGNLHFDVAQFSLGDARHEFLQMSFRIHHSGFYA